MIKIGVNLSIMIVKSINTSTNTNNTIRSRYYSLINDLQERCISSIIRKQNDDINRNNGTNIYSINNNVFFLFISSVVSKSI